MKTRIFRTPSPFPAEVNARSAFVGNDPVFPPERVTLVGVLNVTPDSFSDGGRLLTDAGRVSMDRVLSAA